MAADTPPAGEQNVATTERVRRWWWHLTPQRQDRLAVLAPLAAVVLFLAAIIASFGYLRLEEIDREQEAVKRDVEYSQQRLRLRLLERQEQLMRIARDISNAELGLEEFHLRAEAMVNQYPELERLSWIDERRRIKGTYATASLQPNLRQMLGDTLKLGETQNIYNLARELQQPVYSQRPANASGAPLLQLHIPLIDKTRFVGVVLAEYSVDGLYRYGVPAEVSARYAISLLDDKGQRLAGTSVPPRNAASSLLPWVNPVNEFEVPVSPVGNGLILRAQAYRTSLGVIGSGLFWLVGVLSIMTTWMLIANWRHTRRRQQAQQALVSETNFRRAMENSMPTGMRAMDLQGRITYVNAAFCQMTGWSESELVGRTAPFPYWPDTDHETLTQMLNEELAGKFTPGGVQMRVKRPDNTLFDARLYVSPLIDARGTQTGWMTSMTDITEPNRIREQLSSSFERFTTVLEALDASISVAPLGSDEMLFANKLYRLWFGNRTNGHLQLIAQAGMPAQAVTDESLDQVDSFAGMPTNVLPEAESENAEVYLSELGLWLEVRTRYLSWVDGRLAQMVIATDITSRRLAEQQAAAQADRAQNASRLITMGEMASSVAHELNQPLTAINN
nr:PAS domain S-box protein [Rhodoferax sp.]